MSVAGPEGVDTAAIQVTTAALLRAVNGSDLGGVLAVWSEDGVLMPPHHPSVRGQLELEQYFARLFAETRLSFRFTSSRVHVCGDTAFERVEYVATVLRLAVGEEMHDAGKGLHVYQRQPSGTWKLAMDIWNSDRPASGAIGKQP